MGGSEKQQRDLIDIFNFFLGPFRSIALILLGLVVGGISLALGFEEFQNRKLVEVSLNEYVTMDERPKYVKLTGCVLDLEKACWKTNLITGDPDLAYIPLRPTNASTEEPIHIVVASRGHLSQVMKLTELEKTPEARSTYIEKHKMEMHPTKDIRGWVFQSSLADDLFRENGTKVSPSIWVISEGKTPEFGANLIVGLFCGVLVFIGMGGLYFSAAR